MLSRMTDTSFAAFFEAAVEGYAKDNVASGRWLPDDALQLAREESLRLLPQGLATPDHHLFDIRDDADGRTVGHLWAARLERGQRKVAYIYQLQVLTEFRRQGRARAALLEFERIAGELGFDSVALNVFGSNTAAQALYHSLGFVTTNLNMQKHLPPRGA